MNKISSVNSINNKKSLSTKDLVTCGIFSALFFVFTMVSGMFFAPNPVLTFLTPCALALFTGPIYLLMIAKIKKHGPSIILGIIMGFMMFVTGMYWMWSLFYIIMGILADIISGIGNFRNYRMNILSFIIFSMNPLGSYIMLWVNRDAYFSYMLSKGTEESYVNIMGATAQNWMLPGMILSIIVCGFLSCLIGKSLLKKQFEKAGLVA